jgi:hypothetical protein
MDNGKLIADNKGVNMELRNTIIYNNYSNQLIDKPTNCIMIYDGWINIQLSNDQTNKL